ncbi:kinase-like domain-containing protein [Parachaetomium inaequale]|uniref:Kinase-like domain-containing protein n=1 Tax=Parachaetomium inaequale TaxID=2588326 RepID=A0AAN6PFN0_9PEZI|nr:kinase-like domain-containing protein [Parachaetomium inaequale]
MHSKATPALNTVRGFNGTSLNGTPLNGTPLNGTPLVSGDEDSDCCPTPQPGQKSRAKRARKPHAIDDVVSANCSPALRPMVPQGGLSGISKMRMQLDNLDIASNAANSTAASSRTTSLTCSESLRSPFASDVTTASSGRDSGYKSRTGSGISSEDETASQRSTRYEINLENDFASDANGRTVEDIAPPRRKMTADDFEHLRCLGKGTYGTVLLVKQRTTGRLYAQKQFKKASLIVHKKLVEQTKTERQILESVNRHPFVVKLYYAFQDQEKLYLILEYGQGGELFTHLSTERMFSEEMAAFYMAEMVLALTHLHADLGVVYRDLKPENCLLDAEGHLLLTDFGLSKVAVDPDACNSMLGTVEYMAPEVIQGKKYGRAVDWWSLGALGFDLMTGHPPFRGPNHAKIQDNIVRQKLAMPFFLSADAKDLLTRLLRKDPVKRLGSNMPKDLATIKKHRFFRKIDWKRLAARELQPPIEPIITDPELAENFSREFTELSLSPVVTRFPDVWGDFDGGNGSGSARDELAKDDPFGGFSFVAPNSLLESHGFRIPA